MRLICIAPLRISKLPERWGKRTHRCLNHQEILQSHKPAQKPSYGYVGFDLSGCSSQVVRTDINLSSNLIENLSLKPAKKAITKGN
jgi:hypothetical protein